MRETGKDLDFALARAKKAEAQLVERDKRIAELKHDLRAAHSTGWTFPRETPPDKGETLPPCPKCGKQPIPSGDDWLCDTLGCQKVLRSRDQWLRYVAENTPCQVCGEMPRWAHPAGDRLECSNVDCNRYDIFCLPETWIERNKETACKDCGSLSEFDHDDGWGCPNKQCPRWWDDGGTLDDWRDKNVGLEGALDNGVVAVRDDRNSTGEVCSVGVPSGAGTASAAANEDTPDSTGELREQADRIASLERIREAAQVVVDEMIDIGPHGPDLVKALDAHREKYGDSLERDNADEPETDESAPEIYP